MQIKGTLKIEQKRDEFYKQFLVISNYQRIFNDYCWWSGRLTRISLTRTSRHLSWSRLVPAFSCSTTSSDSHYTTRFRHQVPQNLFRCSAYCDDRQALPDISHRKRLAEIAFPHYVHMNWLLLQMLRCTHFANQFFHYLHYFILVPYTWLLSWFSTQLQSCP